MAKWYKLDNAALIYAPSANRKWSCIFRLSCCLKEPVRPEILQQAVNDVLPRFPTFNVKLRAGVFWYYFDEIKRKAVVEEETGYPCQNLNVRTAKHLFRVLYYGSRIAVEVFHGVSDGGGGLIFLKTIVRRYLEILGHSITGYDGCLNYLDKPLREETEDAYKNVADMKSFYPRDTSRAYQVRNLNAPGGHYYLTHGEMDTGELRALAKAKGCGVGHIVAAAIVYGLYLDRKRALVKRTKKDRKNLSRPVVLCASIDLRRRFPGHNTLRNFSHYINIFLSEKEHDYDTVLEEVKTGFSKITDDYVMQNINANVKTADNFFIKTMPLFIKVFGFSIAYTMFGEPLNTVSMSNYGPTAVPPEFYEHVERFESAIGVAKVGRNLDTSVITFGSKTVLTFCSMGVDTFVETEAYRALSEQGIKVTVDGNRRIFNE